MVSTRSSRRPSPPAEAHIDPLPARQPRRQTKARGKRSSVTRGIDELDPELLSESSGRGPEPPASSPGSLAQRYGEPARRAALVPTEAFSLSQLTTRSSGQGKSRHFTSQDAPSQVRLEWEGEEGESSTDQSTPSDLLTFPPDLLAATPEPGPSQAPRSAQVRLSQASAPVATATPADSEDEPQAASPGESQSVPNNEVLTEAEEQEQSELRKACLKDLALATRKLVDTHYNQTSRPAVRNALIKINRQAFQGLRDIYSADNDFIDVPAVYNSLSPEASSETAHILCQANLANIIDKLASTEDPKELVGIAQLLDDLEFPKPFNPNSGHTDVEPDLVEHAMDIRIQAFIASLASNTQTSRPFKLDKFLRWVVNTFCNIESNGAISDITESDVAEICGIQHPLPPHIAEQCLTRVAVLLEMAEGTTVADVIDVFKKAYPITEWRASLLDFVFTEFFGMEEGPQPESEEPDTRPEDQLRGQEWAQPEDSVQGDQPILGQDEEPEELEGEPEEELGDESEEEPEEELEEELEQEPEEEAEEDPEEELEEELQNSRQPVSARPSKTQPRSIIIQDSDDSDSDSGTAPSPASPQRTIRRPESTGALPFNREMVSFLHNPSSPARPQPPAHRRDGFFSGLASRAKFRIESSQVTSSGKARLVSSQRQPSSSAAQANSRKRPREDDDYHEGQDEEEDDEEEEEFEQDNRQPNERRRRELDRRNMPPPKRQKHAHEPLPARPRPAAAAEPEEEDPFASPPRLLGRPRPRPADPEEEDPFASPRLSAPHRPQPASPAPSATQINFEAIHQRNRLHAAAARPQQRIPWSNEDTHKLLGFIAEHGCSWKILHEMANPVKKSDDPPEKPAPPHNPRVHFSVYRNQQAIRDKARNLKVDFLKADMVLPTGFDNVVLSKKEIALLQSRHRNPDRREADVDARGFATNTYY
ncbi:hypothetical protein F5X68DRAFT_186055 [Plectosphaerella plurivora]|uniref:Myb-like domain-containing protein n=1 Tax=Plectosphaerella plurivora TaxID=936078 RepID=A0A9P8VMA6_9PEZI|nr:hypothetical protein F5X68DRAFT_186055 [Plectosphaerella plurivora]